MFLANDYAFTCQNCRRHNYEFNASAANDRKIKCSSCDYAGYYTIEILGPMVGVYPGDLIKEDYMMGVVEF